MSVSSQTLTSSSRGVRFGCRKTISCYEKFVNGCAVCVPVPALAAQPAAVPPVSGTLERHRECGHLGGRKSVFKPLTSTEHLEERKL